MAYIKGEKKRVTYNTESGRVIDLNEKTNTIESFIIGERDTYSKSQVKSTDLSQYYFINEDHTKKRGSEEFSAWIEFLEKEAINAYRNKKDSKSNKYILNKLKKEISEKFNIKKFNYLESFLDGYDCELQLSLPSLFNSIRFIHETPISIINKSLFFIDQDSLYVNMSFVSRDSRLDLTFKDNGEVSFRFVDCENGRVRITGSSFFGLGKNKEETKKINKLFNLANKGV